MPFKTLATVALAASGFVALQAGATDLTNAEATRAEQPPHAHHSVASAHGHRHAAPAAVANDFLQEAERGEYLRSFASAQVARFADRSAQADALLQAEATRATGS